MTKKGSQGQGRNQGQPRDKSGSQRIARPGQTLFAIRSRLLNDRIGQEIIAGHVRETPVVRRIRELVAAGGELLVATDGDRECVAGDGRRAERLPEFDADNTIADAVAFDFAGAAGVGAGGRGEQTAREPTGRVRKSLPGMCGKPR